MGEMRKLSVTVQADVATDLDQAISSGDYANADEVISDALGLWRKHRERRKERILALIQEALDSGDPLEGNFDATEIHRRGMERLARERSA